MTTLPGPSQPFSPVPGEPRMRRQTPMDHEQIIAYNLRGGGEEYTVFEHAQTDRVYKTRAIIKAILAEDASISSIVEPGCSTGDISGFFQHQCKVLGIDVTPGAAWTAKKRWPRMEIIEDRVENVDPIPCDILVMTEFLEHIIDPKAFVRQWMPLARYVIIGHPLVGDGHDPEEGHPWAYYDVDFANWFVEGGHEMVEAWTFPMGYRMAIGWGRQK